MIATSPALQGALSTVTSVNGTYILRGFMQEKVKVDVDVMASMGRAFP